VTVNVGLQTVSVPKEQKRREEKKEAAAQQYHETLMHSICPGETDL
jgi:hypothetical protein